jgi:hypothetical protein
MNPTQSADMSTAHEMKCLYSCNLHHLRVNTSGVVTLLDFWKKLVKGYKHDGEYSFDHPSIMTAACASPPPNVACVLLDSGISTPDPSRVAWFTCTYFLSISPAIWKLTEELEELNDPPSVCRVTLGVSNLVFREFASAEELVELSNKSSIARGIEIFKDLYSTEFHHKLKIAEQYYHTYVTPQTTELIWFNLINNSRRGENIFVMDLPFPFRMASNVPESLQKHVYSIDKESLCNIPAVPNLDPDSFIGLYSGTLILKCFSKIDGSLPSANHELWPHIPLAYADIEHQRPECVLYLSIQNLKFQSTITEESIRCLLPQKGKEYAVVNWFRPYLNIFDI